MIGLRFGDQGAKRPARLVGRPDYPQCEKGTPVARGWRKKVRFDPYRWAGHEAEMSQAAGPGLDCPARRPDSPGAPLGAPGP
jgi:hypothetical protein